MSSPNRATILYTELSRSVSDNKVKLYRISCQSYGSTNDSYIRVSTIMAFSCFAYLTQIED